MAAVRNGKSNHSNRRDRRYIKRRRVHARIVNVRNDNHHKATTAVADPGMSGFLAKLEYRCGWYGAEYVKAHRWFASSKLCARCRRKNDDLTLSDREWWCGGCGTLNDRDPNAAMDLEQWPGLRFPVS